ncbi:MAG: PilN domain-containing protein [Deltaproteobacteria bacterium]|nr:PilN domain-containing protein [Candidatus Anaeroferrophillus wilburensis]MBN2888098.1 PilN domain-containing protein [Deltaproteobacteria bacterium]
MIRINLLPVRAERKKQTLRNQMAIGIGIILLTLVVCGVAQVMISSKVKSVKAGLQRTQKQIAALQPVIDKIDQYKKQKEEISRKIEVINNLDSSRLLPVKTLHDINQYKPDKLWLTSLSRKNTLLEIKGIAIDNETIVEFLNNVKQSEQLQQSELVYLKSKALQDLELKEFMIKTLLPSTKTTTPEEPATKQAKSKGKGKRKGK